MIDVEFILGVCVTSLFIAFAVGAIIVNIFDRNKKEKDYGRSRNRKKEK